GDQTITLGGGNLLLLASTGIGASAHPILTSGLTNVSAITTSGDIYINNNTGTAVNVTGVTVGTHSGTGIQTSGNISLSTAGDLDINAIVRTTGNNSTVTITADNDTDGAGDLTIAGTAAASVRSKDGNITLEGENIIIGTNGFTGYAYTSGTGNIDINADRDAGNDSDVTIGNDGYLKAGGNITIDGARDVIINNNASNNQIQASGSIGIGTDGANPVTGDVTIENDLNAGTSLTVDANGNISVNNATLTTGTGDLTLHADNDSSGAGDLTIGSTFVTTLNSSSNNQNIILYGENISIGTGAATTLNAGSGDIILHADMGNVGGGIEIDEPRVSLAMNNFSINSTDRPNTLIISNTPGANTISANDLASASGNVNLYARGGGITVSAPLAITNSLTIGTTGNVSIGADTSGSSVTVNASGTVTDTGGVITTTGGNLTITGSGIGTSTNALDVSVTGGNLILTTTDATGSGDIYITSGASLSLGTINTAAFLDTVDIETTSGNITIASVSNIDDNLVLDSAGNILVNTNFTANSMDIDAGGSVTDVGAVLTTTNGDLDIDASGIGSSGNYLDVSVTGGNLILTSDANPVYITSAGNIPLGAVTTSGGDVTITTTGGGNLTLNAAVLTSGGAINFAPDGSFTQNAQINSGSGDITITTDNIALGANISGSGNITLQPENAGTSIGINSASGTFNLNTTEIGYLQDGFSSITIGRSNGNGAIDIRTITFNDPVTIQSPSAGGTITVNGTITGLGDASITLDGPGGTTTLNANIIT
ncbi:hypothetical protein DRJ16_06450, partial [Candidatus Woesearchaeota archaeon]